MPKLMPGDKVLTEELDELDKALDTFTQDMRARLHEKAKRGYRGWDDPKMDDQIRAALQSDAIRARLQGDCLHFHDIANRAMMLWWVAWRKDQP